MQPQRGSGSVDTSSLRCTRWPRCQRSCICSARRELALPARNHSLSERRRTAVHLTIERVFCMMRGMFTAVHSTRGKAVGIGTNPCNWHSSAVSCTGASFLVVFSGAAGERDSFLVEFSGRLLMHAENGHRSSLRRRPVAQGGPKSPLRIPAHVAQRLPAEWSEATSGCPSPCPASPCGTSRRDPKKRIVPHRFSRGCGRTRIDPRRFSNASSGARHSTLTTE
jgi:hypothetical protein